MLKTHTTQTKQKKYRITSYKTWYHHMSVYGKNDIFPQNASIITIAGTTV